MSSATTKPIGLGFVGLSAKGWASHALAPPLFQAPLNQLYNLVAVSTSRISSAEESAKAYTEKTGHVVKGYHGSTVEIAADPDVHFVAVSVKVPEHAEAIKPILAANKGVFSEWPLARNLIEARELVALAKEANVRTLVGLQAWQSPLVAKVRTWISEGKIGRVLSMTWIASKPDELGWWGPAAKTGSEYALDAANGATLLSIIGGHDLTAVTRMVGPISNVSAVSGKLFPSVVILDAEGKPTNTMLPHTFADNIAFSGTLAEHPGAVANVFWRSVPTGGDKNVHRPSLLGVIDGDEGVIRFEASGPASHINLFTPTKVYLNNEEIVLEDTPMLGNTSRNWAEFAKGDKGDYPTWEDAVKMHELLDAIETSAETGTKVTVGA